MASQHRKTLNELAPKMTRRFTESTIEKVTMNSLFISQPLEWDQVPFNKFEYPSDNLQREFYLDEKNGVWKLEIREPDIREQKPTKAFTDTYKSRESALQQMYGYITARENVPHLDQSYVSVKDRFYGLNQKTFNGFF